MNNRIVLTSIYRFSLFIYVLFMCNFPSIGINDGMLQATNERKCSLKRALIFGIFGQDGTHLTEFLLNREYEVYGVSRADKEPNNFKCYLASCCRKGLDKLHILSLDITNKEVIQEIIERINPDEIYNLAAQSNVGLSFKEPYITVSINSIGTLNILDALRLLKSSNKPKFFQASSVEIFGNIEGAIYNELTPFNPCSAYGESKLFAHRMVQFYRKYYNVFACNGILCNHESYLRGENFITKIVTKAVAEIYTHKREFFSIGNLNAQRDWGAAQDYVEGMWLTLQAEKPDDFLFATGEIRSVRELIEEAFSNIGISIGWKGQGVDEVGYDKATEKVLVTVNPAFFRPVDIITKKANTEKALSVLKWKPKTSFAQLIKEMVLYEIEMLKTHH